MNYRKCLISDLRENLDNGSITSEELFNEAVSLANKYQVHYNCFVTICDKFKMKKGTTPLAGIPYVLKDNISTSNILTTASSNILKNYVPVYDATVYKKLKNAGAVLVGKTVLDELAMGGTGTTGHTGIVRNPYDKTREIGGSSAGSAAAVALGIVPFAIGSDTGDSIRKPAAFGGVVGYKPTYGLISRYGLFAFASSLDHVGCFARSVKDVALVTNTIKGYDSHDMTTYQDDSDLLTGIDEPLAGKKLFYIKEIVDRSLYKEDDDELMQVLDNFYSLLERLKTRGAEITEVSIDKALLEAIYPTYMTISCAEATSNNSNLTGIAFGNRIAKDDVNSLITATRTEGFSELIKRRFVLGSYILQKENQEKLYLNACRVRRLLVDKLTNLFKEYDSLILPCSGGPAPKFDDDSDKLSDKYLLLENHMALGNFGGFLSITIPSGFVNNCPIGINLTSGIKEDKKVLNIANEIEMLTGLKGQIGGEE